MSYALVDNATLTGVQRLLGEIPLNSRDVVDADLAAFESLLNGILLFDEVVAIDDYKEEFRKRRHERFDFIRFLSPTEFGLVDVESRAAELSRLIDPVIESGEFADGDLRPLLDRLRMHIVCTWDMSSSVYFLTMKVLGAPDAQELKKYSTLQAAIFGELEDLFGANGAYDNEAILVDSKGNRIRSDYKVIDKEGREADVGGPNKQLQAFIASLRWLASRTAYYALAADHLRADLLLYPIRQAYHINFMERTSRYTSDFVAALTNKLSGQVRDTVEAVTSANRTSQLSMPLPIFAAWLVDQTGDIREVIPAAFAIRDEDELSTAREQLRHIRVLLDTEDTQEAMKKAQKLLRDLEGALAGVRRKYGLRTTQGPTLSHAIQVVNPLLQMHGAPKIPDVGRGMALPAWLSDNWPRRGTGALYRDIARDLADFPRLGRVRDLLGAAVDIETKNAQSYLPKVEDPQFRWARSYWKLPM